MTIPFLPSVDNCCFCIPLQWGSIIIAVCTMLNCGWSFASSYVFVCLVTGLYALILDITLYVIWASSILTFIGSIIFLFGVIKGIPETATIFNYTLLFSILINVANIVVAVVLSILGLPCSPWNSIMPAVGYLIVWLYFTMVINSYEDEM